MRARALLFAWTPCAGLTEQWSRSVCLFHAMLGGAVFSNEFLNNRPAELILALDKHRGSKAVDGIFKGPGGAYDEAILEAAGFRDPLDEALYAHAKALFERRAKAFDLSACTAFAERVANATTAGDAGSSK